MKKSAQLQAEEAFVENYLGDREICDKCTARLDSYAVLCNAELSDACPGFLAIEAAREKFKEMFKP